MNEIQAEKARIREEMRRKRRLLSDQVQADAAQQLFAYLKAYEPYRRAQCVMGYMACRGELSLAPVLGDVLAGGRMLVLPRCEDGNCMTARRVSDIAGLPPGRYGLQEPGETDEIIPPEAIDLILVPGTAFGMDGTRIGQGGGYYDRFMAQTQALRIGVCHDFARLSSVPADTHDLRIDVLITPAGVFDCRMAE